MHTQVQQLNQYRMQTNHRHKWTLEQNQNPGMRDSKRP